MSQFEDNPETQLFIQKSTQAGNSNTKSNPRLRAEASADGDDLELEGGRIFWHRRRAWSDRYGPPRSVVLLLLAFCAILLLRTFSRLVLETFDWDCSIIGKHAYRPTTPTLGVPKDVQHKWAQYSPYHAEGEYHAPPKGCVIDQVSAIAV